MKHSIYVETSQVKFCKLIYHDILQYIKIVESDRIFQMDGAFAMMGVILNKPAIYNDLWKNVIKSIHLLKKYQLISFY